MYVETEISKQEYRTQLFYTVAAFYCLNRYDIPKMKPSVYNVVEVHCPTKLIQHVEMFRKNFYDRKALGQ